MDEICIKLLLAETTLVIVAAMLVTYSIKKLNDELKRERVINSNLSEDLEVRVIGGCHHVFLDDKFKELCRERGIVSKLVMLNILEEKIQYVLEMSNTYGLAGLNYKYSEGFFVDMTSLKGISNQEYHALAKLFSEKVPDMDREALRVISIHLLSVES